MELTILMPCLNEALTLPVCIKKARGFIDRAGIKAEILVSDNGSTDRSVEIAESLGARVVHAPIKGYGGALMAGIHAAQGRYVIMGDADDSYDFSALDEFLGALRNGADLVIGNRFKGGIAPGAMPRLHRYLGNPVLSFIGRLFFRIPAGDFHCGLRGFSKQAVMNLGLVSSGMEFATEMIAKAARAGCTVTEVPTTLSPDGRDRPPHLRTWRDGWRHLLFMLLFSPRWLFLLPGLLLVSVGVVLSIMLANGPIVLRGVGLDIHTLLYASAIIIVGVQMVQFALLTKWLAVLAGMAPSGRWFQKWGPFVRVEWGLVGGGALFLAGAYWSARMISEWSTGGYASLEPRLQMRTVIPAVTMMVLGMQACAGSLFAAALHLTWKTAGKR